MAETITVVRDFFKDLGAMGLSESQLLGLDIPKRKELFLRWKWYDSSSFNDLEGSRKSNIYQMTKEDVGKIIDDAERKYWSNVLKFEAYCTEVLKRIGVLPSDAASESVFQKAAASVGGQVVGGYRRDRKDWE